MNAMFNHGDAFIALPGGQIERDLSYFLLGPTAHKPIDLSNVNGFF
jgi:hypothetical protein